MSHVSRRRTRCTCNALPNFTYLSQVCGSRVICWAGRGSGGDPGLPGEVVDGGLVGAVGGAQRGGCGRAGVGELGQAGAQEPVVDAGEEAGGAQPGVGDLVAEGVRDAFDEAVQAQPPQVVGDLPAGHEPGSLPEQGRQVAAQVGVGEAVRQQAEDAQDGEEGQRARVGQAQPGHAGPGRGDDRVGDLGQGVGSGDGVVAEYLGAQQAPVGGEADLPQRGQVGQPFADPEVAGVIDGGFRPDRLAQLVVLLDLRVLVVHVQARGDPVGDDPGAEPARGGAAGPCG